MSEKSKEAEEEFSFNCPSCNQGRIVITKTVYELPDKDQMLIIKFECNKCKFTNNDIIPLTTNFEPGIKILRIETEEDLKSKIYRSPVATLEIPELELLVEPGPAANFYYTNIEGVLERFERAVLIYSNELPNNSFEKREIQDLLEMIAKARKAEFPITLKLTDNEGGSYIIPQDESKYKFLRSDSINPDTT
ncbi:MAG: ZPR1 zinc finger domain-containing protein [Candidatus Thorarchaeota archaeon]